MSYIDDLNALFAKQETSIKRNVAEQTAEEKVAAASRNAATGRLGSPVQEWTYDKIAKTSSNALANALAQLGASKTSLLFKAAQLEKAEKYAKKMAKRQQLSKFLALGGTIIGAIKGGPAGAAIGGAAGRSLGNAIEGVNTGGYGGFSNDYYGMNPTQQALYRIFAGRGTGEKPGYESPSYKPQSGGSTNYGLYNPPDWSKGLWS